MNSGTDIPKTRSIFPLSINTYGILFILLTLVSFGTITAYSLLQIDEIKESSTIETSILAKKELTNTILNIENELNQTAKKLTEWEELKQQLINPTYYAYWQKSRMPSATFLPTYFNTVEVYDKKGIPLSSKPVSILQLTERLRKENIYINQKNNTIYQIRTIKTSESSVAGYIIAEYDLTEIFYKKDYLYIDKKSISINSNSETISLNEIEDNLTYEIRKNDAFDSLQKVIFSTIVTLAIVGACISIILWVMISFFSGKPLQVLAKHIDSLKLGEFTNLAQNLNKLQITKEYETVRVSFNRFQELLTESESALRFSESRLQTVLENISVGIVTFDEHLMIDSCNAEIIKTFGYKNNELIGSSINSLIDKESQNACHYQIEKILSNDTKKESPDVNEIEISGIKSNKETFDLGLSINKVNFAGKQILVAMLRDISSEKKAHEKLEQMANYDALTTLPNRVLFHDRLIHAVEQAKRKKNLVGLLFIDLDRFKIINDSLGHHIGDLLLIKASKRIRSCIREGDTVARLGGDEFTIINEGVASQEESIQVAIRINEEIRKPFVIDGKEHFISTSIGITFFPQDATKVDELIKHADTAMYDAKDNGGDNYKLFTKALSENSNQRLKIENRLRYAIENQEFELFYQPRIDLTNQKISSFETLLRWKENGQYRVSPAEFIPILEDTGMIINAGNWIINEVCLQINHWMNAGLDFNRIAINLSARQFKNKTFLNDIEGILITHGITAKQLEFEITESLLIDNIEETISILQTLHDKGFHISIDDFGTGYSSLAYLKQFPIDTIKIDQCFIKHYPDDKSDIAIIESIIAIAENLNMSITAEGIESSEQLKYLTDCGCHEVQGFYFAKPMPASTVPTWVKQFEKSRPLITSPDLQPQ